MKSSPNKLAEHMPNRLDEAKLRTDLESLADFLTRLRDSLEKGGGTLAADSAVETRH
jgi:hypothetical protein